jgi:hypothetical protein
MLMRKLLYLLVIIQSERQNLMIIKNTSFKQKIKKLINELLDTSAQVVQTTS